MTGYRESDTSDADSLPHCLGLAYAGRRALDPGERERLATRITRRTWRAIGLALGVPATSFAALLFAARSGEAPLVVVLGAALTVGSIAAITVAIESAPLLLRLRRDRERGEVLRFEGVLPEDVLEDPDARRLASLGLLKQSASTSVELLPGSALVWRAHDVIVEAPWRLSTAPAPKPARLAK